jgi:hypothetical protein
MLDGLRLIRLNSASVDERDEDYASDYPYKLDVNLAPPDLMIVAFVMLHGGSEELIVRGKTRDVIDQFVALNDLQHHPRLRRMTITGPDDHHEEFRR